MFLERRCPSCQRRSRFVCDRCLARFNPSGVVQLSGLDQVRSIFDYDQSLGRVILAAKNQGRRDILRQFGRRMGDETLVNPAVWGDPSQWRDPTASPKASKINPVEQFDVVTWVPASPANRRRRGYDQGLLLARSVARHGRLPIRRLLTRRGGPQKGRGREERLAGVELWPVCPVPMSVLVVDDVVTTGASLQQSASALRRGGARFVSAMTIASTGWSAPGRE